MCLPEKGLVSPSCVIASIDYAEVLKPAGQLRTDLFVQGSAFVLVGILLRIGPAAKETFAKPVEESPYHRDKLTRWDFGDLPDEITFTRGGRTLTCRLRRCCRFGGGLVVCGLLGIRGLPLIAPPIVMIFLMSSSLSVFM